MDIVLEVCDTFFFDHLYAKLFPLPPAVAGLVLQHQQQQLQQQLVEKTTTSTFDLLFNSNVSFIPQSPYEYTLIEAPATAYLTTIARTNLARQAVSLFFITWIFGILIYFTFASLSYLLIFDKRTFNHPKYLKNQMRLEIQQTMSSIPLMSLYTVPWFLAELHGYSLLYWNKDDYPSWHLVAQYPLFIAFTDFGIYLIHRGLHHPSLYKSFHKPHHKWIMPTPYASHAFHPIDGYLQSLPYHIFPFIFPLHKISYLILFTFINIWTVLIHDGEYMTNNPVVNGAACHTLHHLYFNYNYGQFTTLWDRIGGSYRRPENSLFDSQAKMDKKTWSKQVNEMERIVQTVEDDDDRQYAGDSDEKKTN
ncbi:hypothetical protein V1514DRAFT_334051 [Lipomyces japonicus]|uniref:uncharacterized protein n=1 Tax=Lipomyces japonicus TaxID=56871 RepID=UPI0034CEE2F0